MSPTAVWIGIAGIIIAVICAGCAGYYWTRNQITDNDGIDSELNYFDELVHEHEQGIADNRERLKWLIQLIGNNYDISSLSSGRIAHLGRIRRMLSDTPQELAENDADKTEQPELPFGQS
jgi:hypothetical protein